MEKKPLEFASEFHSRMLGRIKEMLDPYREQIAHDLMKNENEIEEVEEDDTHNEDKVYKDMYKERKKFFDKKAKGMPKPFDKSHGLKSSRVEEVEPEELTELSKKTLKSYMAKSSKEAVGLAGDITKGGKKDKGTLNKFKNRVTGVHRAKSAVDEEQQLDERDWSFKAEKARRNKNNTRVGMEQKPYTQRDRDNEKKIPMAREEVEDC